jgi:hypothetical protein
MNIIDVPVKDISGVGAMRPETDSKRPTFGMCDLNTLF